MILWHVRYFLTHDLSTTWKSEFIFESDIIVQWLYSNLKPLIGELIASLLGQNDHGFDIDLDLWSWHWSWQWSWPRLTLPWPCRCRWCPTAWARWCGRRAAAACCCRAPPAPRAAAIRAQGSIFELKTENEDLRRLNGAPPFFHN